MPDVTSTFLVRITSSALGAGAAEGVLDKHTRTILRALDMQANGAEVLRFNGDAWEPVVYDGFGDDMGNHEGHDRPFVVPQQDEMAQAIIDDVFEQTGVKLAWVRPGNDWGDPIEIVPAPAGTRPEAP